LKYYVVAILVLIIAFYVLFQVNTLPEKWQDYTEHIDSDFRGYAILEDLCLNVGGRIAGTQKGKQAEEFVINYLDSFGYDEILIHKFDHIGWIRKQCTLNIKDSTNKLIKSVNAMSLGLSPANTNIEFQLVDLHNGTNENYIKYSEKALKNKIVLVDKKSPIGHNIIHRVDKVKTAQNNGAQGMIIYNQLYGNVISVGAAAFDTISKIPALSITREDGLELKELIQSHNHVKAEIKVENKIFDASSQNISIEIPGTEFKDEVVLISAHLDAWAVGQGAVDNGANVAVLLELARQLKIQKIQSKRTIRIIFFMAEEFGFVGSKHFIMDNDSLVNNLFYVLNLEMNLSPNGINLLLDDCDRDWFENLTLGLKTLGMQKKVISDPWLESDQVYFMMSGIPTLTFTEKTDIFAGHKYHSSGDNIGLIKSEDIKNCVKVMGIVLREIANASELKKWRLSNKEINLKMEESGLDVIVNLRNMKI
jgi:carboxypeptidase Q